MSVLSVAPISYENSITKKELPLNIFQGKFPIAIKREVSIRIYKTNKVVCNCQTIKEGGVKTMDNKQVNKAPQKSARLVLQAVTAIARSNANSLCRGLLYEPKVPTQLKK